MVSVPFTRIKASSPLKCATDGKPIAVSASARIAEFAWFVEITYTSPDAIDADVVNVFVNEPPLPLK